MSNSGTSTTPSCIYSSAVTTGPTASVQTTATPKSPPKVNHIGKLPSDEFRTGLKKPRSGGPGLKKITNGAMKSFTEEKHTPVEAWYYNPNSEEDPDEKDPTLPHHYKPERQVPQEHLHTLGVLVWTALKTNNYKKNPFYEQVKNERGYNYEEVVTVAPGRLANYEQSKKDFFKEHLHEHEEIRLILEGGGYEDIRDFDGHWIRIHITQGVLIVLPKGMYHRFTVDHTNYLKAVLLYKETPSRIQFERNPCTDIMEVREHYVMNVLSRGSSLQGNSEDLSNMLEGLEGLDEELEILRQRQEIVEATLDESTMSADDAQLAAQFKAEADLTGAPAPAPTHPQLLHMAHIHAAPPAAPPAAAAAAAPAASMDVDV